MAGHSKFKNIQHRKGAQDKKRAKIFARLTKEIMVAAKMGMPDPDANPRLRTAVLAARAQNMPKDNIERAIKKSSDDADTNYEEVRYEGFGPGGIGVIVETLTDNRNRTAAEVRSTFSKNGGNLGETGSVSFMFDRVGAIEFEADVADAEAVASKTNKWFPVARRQEVADGLSKKSRELGGRPRQRREDVACCVLLLRHRRDVVFVTASPRWRGGSLSQLRRLTVDFQTGRARKPGSCASCSTRTRRSTRRAPPRRNAAPRPSARCGSSSSRASRRRA